MPAAWHDDYIYIYIYICTHTYIYIVCVCIDIMVRVFTNGQGDIYIYIYSACTFVDICIFVFVCVCVYVYIYKLNAHDMYAYIYIHTHTHEYIYIYRYNRHFMPTYFLLDPFEFPYYFYRIRGELIYVLSIVVCIPSTFCPTLGHHQERIYYKSDVTFVLANYYCVRTSLPLNTSSIAQHLKRHSCPTTQLWKILTTILEHQNNKQKLQILEALYIRNLQPALNRINFQTSANVHKCL